MKLSDHVDKIRVLTHKSFSNYFARLGITAKKVMEIEKLLEELKPKREKVDLVIKNHLEETKSFAAAYEKTLDEYTFTLFNRIAAVKVMEAHRLFPEVITKRPENGNRSFSHRAWLENNKDMAGEELEGVRQFIKFEFNRLGDEIPLYHKDYPYALLPYIIELNEIIDAFNSVEKDPDINEAIWKSDDILGWLYESYNNAKKLEHKASKKKTEYDKVFLQSQVYTPRWVVKFLVDNSLGKLYLEMYPDSEIKNKYIIANAPDRKVREIKPLHEVTIIDPAVGSGNFLFYAFDLFYDFYMDQIDNYGADYDEDEIPKLIIENNLHGIDIDNRAVQIAQLGLYIKAMRKKRDIHIEKFNVVSSDFVLPDYEETRHIFESNSKITAEQKVLIADIWSELQYAYKFGSLIRLDEKLKAKLKILEAKQNSVQLELFTAAEIIKQKDFAATFFVNLKTAVEQYAQAQGNTFLTSKTRDAITFLVLLKTEYDVAAANPPYTDSSDFGPELKTFIEANYKKPYSFHTNLYATFIKRCYEFTREDGKIAMIHPDTFMFIKSFEDVRSYILRKMHIGTLVHMGTGGVFGSRLRVIYPVLYVMDKIQYCQKSVVIDLRDLRMDAELERATLIKRLSNLNYLLFDQNKFLEIPSFPFIYWISNEFRAKFKSDSVKDLLKNCQGLATGNNNRFLRFWWELCSADEKINRKEWVYYAKGGPYKKWTGNLWVLVYWKSNGLEIKNFKDHKGKQKSRPQNEGLYFKKGVTYSASGGRPSYRLLPEGCIFDVGGSSIFPVKSYRNNSYIIAFFNSALSKYVIECLNPTLNKQVGDVERVPFVIPPEVYETEISKLSEINVAITTHMRSFILFEGVFIRSPLSQRLKSVWRNEVSRFFNYENHLLTQVLLNETIINENIFKVYELTEHDKAMVLAKEGESIGNLPVGSEALEAYLAEEETTKEFPLKNIRDFIEALPVKEFTPEERETIESEFTALYQNNNDLEGFCIRHRVNPINVWYWFKQSNVIPKQRMHTLAMEFLVDLIREILMEDDDGIAPLVRSAGEEILIDRVEKRFIEKGFTSAQFASFDNVLGRELNEYLNSHLFKALSDYLNLFLYLPKTPFIWHITSGPHHGFDAYIIIYKWNRDRLYLLKSVHIEKRETALKNRQSDLQNDDTAKAQNEKDLISKQLKEIENLKTKIDELLAEGYNPVLDDGVGKNIAPLQKKGIIAYEVLNKGQLEKYLNADW